MLSTTKVLRKKLLLQEKVEVRSLDDGFLGSWHSGTVIAVEDSARLVRYDHLLNDESTETVTELVKVSPVVDGASGDEVVVARSYRGFIRPLQPPCELGTWRPRYGECVDFSYADAWWEGVVIGDEDERMRIFFPDLGDEMVAGVDLLRVSRDWDEFTEEWKPRGKWVFLEAIEEVGNGWPMPVSVKQIWYNVRMEGGFEKLGEWTCSEREIWRELVTRVFFDNMRLTIEHLFMNLNSSLDVEELRRALLEHSEPVLDVVLKIDSVSAVPFEGSSQYDREEGMFLSDLIKLRKVSEKNNRASISANESDVASPILSRSPDSAIASNNCEDADMTSTEKLGIEWQPLTLEKISDISPNAIDECAKMFKLNKSPPRNLELDVRRQLLHLGWRIEYAVDNAILKLRYFSPDGKLFDSLATVCMEVEGTRSSSLAGSRKRSKMVTSDKLFIEPYYCPEAVRDYYTQSLTCENMHSLDRDSKGKLTILKVKKHLSAIGWSFDYRICNKVFKKRELRYKSPCGKPFYTLISACRWYIESGGLESLGKFPLDDKPLNQQNGSKEVNSSGGVEAYKSRISRKKRKHDESLSIEGSQLPKGRIKPSRSSKIKFTCSDSSTPVQHSNKRANDIIASPPKKIPRNVLSWLIDNKVVPPRARVYYQNRNSALPLAEGRVTRGGIKCGCCGEIFSLRKFEAHAGITSHRPSANILLEDGRSLMDCQSQLKKHLINIVMRSESREMRRQQRCNNVTSDLICSICHYGGDLVLCDQCPSSYHTRCIGLKEVPEGDWFCQRCCCQVCGGRSLFDKNKGDTDSVLICGQCEKRYHAKCLRHKEIKHHYQENHWFCGDICQQIFCGLRKILRKPHPVGTDDLTLTLLKYIKSESYDSDVSDDECLIEDYSKLNVALTVMHDCFDPVKEHSTKRDLVEDAIFCRWSMLHRLNFQGFYTLLLEKDEELISTAIVRIHGNRVAEIPLVATRFHYRRLGMCRILMDELERQLTELGVERLILPAVPSVLNTWINSFGFSEMNEGDRLKYLDFTFLGFQGTVFCQKELTHKPSSVVSISTPLAETHAMSCDHMKKNCIKFDGNSRRLKILMRKQ